MDPLSHAITGSLLGQSVARNEERRLAALIGALAGMAPDLDVLIRSSDDALLQIEYHRHFTHALAFVPIGALLCALLGFVFLRSRLTFSRLYLFCFVGYLQGGLLDACTSYGTRLWWPFSDERVAWSTIAIVDPLYTLPLLGLTLAAVIGRRRLFALSGLAWMLAYLVLGLVQRERAESAGYALAAARGIEPIRLEAKPSIFNNMLFRVICEADDRLYTDAVRVGWFSEPVVVPGDSVVKPSVDALFKGAPAGSTLHRDIARFTYFSDGWVYFIEGDSEVIGDFRYALLPVSIETLWTLQINRKYPDLGGKFVTQRNVDDSTWPRFWQMLKGDVRNAQGNH